MKRPFFLSVRSENNLTAAGEMLAALRDETLHFLTGEPAFGVRLSGSGQSAQKVVSEVTREARTQTLGK